MNYELAKKLKDAGFPQLGHNSYAPENWKLLSDGSGRGMPIDHKQGAYFPTLSELIKECGDEFIELSKTEHGWEASAASDDREFNHDKYEHGWYAKQWWHGDGKTSEEAVANLWIALNGKNN